MSNATQSLAGTRITSLLDANSFVEIGQSVTARNTDFNMTEKKAPSDGVITGYGVIDGNLVYVYSQDASVLKGSIGEMHARKIANIYDMAMKMGAPVIGLVDCAGLRLQEATDALEAFGTLYLKQSLASGVIPQITAIFGTCGGGLSLVPALTDFTFMEEKNAKLFVNSPNAIPGNTVDKCDTSSAKFQSEKTGLVDGVGTEEEILSQVKEELESLRMFCEIGEGSIAVDETEDIDWINNWKKYFKQFYVDDILIIPSWEEVKEEDKDKMIIHIDPGTAFGTGMHETTQLCIRQLKKYVTPETELLDVGTGSGILSIIALKMGAKHAVGTDLDPCAVPAVEENKEVNGIIPESFDMMIGNIIDDKEVQDKVGYGCYDIVVANILADVLVPLTPVIVNQMKPGAVYITSGIIDDKEPTVVDAVKAAGLEILEVTYQGEWVSVTARKQA